MTVDQNASEAERKSVLCWLQDFNNRENPSFMESLSQRAEQEFFLIARDSEDSVLGGIRFSILHKWLKVDVMAVSPECRRQGIGQRLLAASETLAARHGCIYAYVDTMSFQAPGFYSHMGYCETGRLVDWDSHGHDKIFLTKPLT